MDLNVARCPNYPAKDEIQLRAKVMRQIKGTAKKAVMPSNRQRKTASRHINMRLKGWNERNEPVYHTELNHSPTTQEGNKSEEPQTKQKDITISKLQTLCQLTTGQYTQYDLFGFCAATLILNSKPFFFFGLVF